MAKKTLSQRLCEALVMDGRTEVVPGKTRKYKTFILGDPSNSNDYYFVGKAGALRRGSCSTRSHPAPAYRIKLLKMVEE